MARIYSVPHGHVHTVNFAEEAGSMMGLRKLSVVADWLHP